MSTQQRALLRHCLSVTACFALFAPICTAQQPTVTRIEENDPSIVYTGMWYPNSEEPHSAHAAALTNANGATATISFTGTGITWVGPLDPYSGIAIVYLDGVQNMVDTYGPNTLYQQPLFSVHGLAHGTHTLSINVPHVRDEYTMGSWIWIDAFDIENGAGVTGGPTASGKIEQNDAAIRYSGNWYLNTNPVMSGGSAALAMDVNSSATVTFSGTGIRWLGYRDQWSGVASVYVDGTLQSKPVDTYSATELAQTPIYTINGLSEGSHTLRIVVTGTRNSASGGAWVWLDAFVIAP